MSFVFVPVTQLKVKIPVIIPGDLGKSRKSEFTATFEKLSVSDRKALTEKLRGGELTDDDVLQKYCIDLEGIEDEAGNPIEFSQGLLKQFLDVDFIRAPLTEAFFGLLYGDDFIKSLKSKN